MTFLAGWQPIALAAGLTIPPLVALYFLKLKRNIAPISSTFLWKRAVEDLHVNAPFQRLRSNLLLLLQLLVLLLAAFALGKPTHQAVRQHEDTLILLIDHSASMNVEEAGGHTRLELAQEEAKRIIGGMSDRARAMVIAFADRATVVSSFGSDRAAIQRRIDSIEPTQSLTRLTEAVALAEAYSQNLIIAGAESGTDVAPTSAAPPATTLIFSDGRIEDLSDLTVQRLDPERMQLVNVGQRTDNVGIISMSARRSYEQPDILSVFAEIRNFGPEPVAFDAFLSVDGRNRDVQTVRLQPGTVPAAGEGDTAANPETNPAGADLDAGPPPGSVASVAFDPFEYGGDGVVQVRIQHPDALSVDNRAWAVVDPPRRVKVLLVTEGNMSLEGVLDSLPIQTETMTPEEYEAADESVLAEGDRNRYDLVIFDAHSTKRLYSGSYFFWGSIPLIEGVSLGDPVQNEIIINWDDTHPLLRYVPVEDIEVYEWYRLTLPPEAQTIIDGESSPILSYIARRGSRYLICAFSLLTQDEVGQPMLNTMWVFEPHFTVFMYNVVTYMCSSLSMSSRPPIQPGDPVALWRPAGTSTLRVVRPDGTRDRLTLGKAPEVFYGRTRRVGVYRVEPAGPGQQLFAVNLFSAAESNVRPARKMSVGGTTVAGTEGTHLVDEPQWPYLLLAALGILLLEWIIYNKRVFV